MSYVNKGSTVATVTVSREPDRSGNFVCDGVADDVQIQAAIDWLPDEGGSIYLGVASDAAPFIISQSLIVDKPILVAGTGVESTVLEMANGVDDDMWKYEGSNGAIMFTTFFDFKMNGNKDNNAAGRGFDFNADVIDGVMTRLWVDDFEDEGIYLASGWGWRIHNLVVEHCGGHGIHIAGNVQTRIEFNVLSINGAAGLRMEADRSQVVGNEFLQNQNEGIDMSGDNCAITSNMFRSNSMSGVGNRDNLWLNGHENVVAHNQFFGESISRYAVNIGSVNRNIVKDNHMEADHTAGLVNDGGTDTRFAKAPFQFTEAIVGAAQISSPTGILVDANTEEALAWGQIPVEAQEVQKIKIWAVATDAPIGAGGQMHLAITFNAGASNAAYNTAATSWTLANFDSEEADYVANDVVHWIIEDGDVSNEILALAPGDSFEIFAEHEAGADPDGATSAVFRVVEVEYV